MSKRLELLLGTAAARPKVFFALPSELPHALELTALGLLRNIDETDPGCFELTPKGDQMLIALDRLLENASAAKPAKV